MPMSRRLSLAVLLFAAGVSAAVGLCGCEGQKSSPEADAVQLEQAFGVKAGPASRGDNSPADLAATAVTALRSRDWVKALPILTQLRNTKGLTASQLEAVHNASSNAYVKLVGLANKGNPEAKAMLERLDKEQNRR
jgi:hypothetical protein